MLIISPINFMIMVLTMIFNQVAERKYEVIEAMCHPAYLDHEILENSSYTYKRVLEQKILKSEKTDALIENLGIELISFKDIL